MRRFTIILGAILLTTGGALAQLQLQPQQPTQQAQKAPPQAQKPQPAPAPQVSSAFSYNFIQGKCGKQFSGYFNGICQAMTEGIVILHENICMPPAATFGQATSIAVKYAEALPERWHESRWVLFSEALQKAWPCRR